MDIYYSLTVMIDDLGGFSKVWPFQPCIVRPCWCWLPLLSVSSNEWSWSRDVICIPAVGIAPSWNWWGLRSCVHSSNKEEGTVSRPLVSSSLHNSLRLHTSSNSCTSLFFSTFYYCCDLAYQLWHRNSTHSLQIYISTTDNVILTTHNPQSLQLALSKPCSLSIKLLAFVNTPPK